MTLSSARPSLLFLHGFTGKPESFAEVEALIRGSGSAGHDFDSFAPALTGHSQSAPDVPDFQAELVRLLAVLPPNSRTHLVGYSLGARLALGLLLLAPERFSSALLIGVNPGLETEHERRERLVADARWAELLSTRGLNAFLDAWQEQPLFATQKRLPPERLARARHLRERHDPKGLAQALNVLGLGQMPNYWNDLPRLALPITLTVGDLDTKFLGLAERAAKKLPNARVLVAKDAGHDLVLERPELIATTLLEGYRP